MEAEFGLSPVVFAIATTNTQAPTDGHMHARAPHSPTRAQSFLLTRKIFKKQRRAFF